jgi:type I restriction enzyme M protein
LEECNLYSILDLPQGIFTGTPSRTVVLYFEKGKSTKKIYYYQLQSEQNFNLTNPLTEKHLEEFINSVHKKKLNKNSWLVDSSNVEKKTYDLSVINPNNEKKIDNRAPSKIFSEIESIDSKINNTLKNIKRLIDD